MMKYDELVGTVMCIIVDKWLFCCHQIAVSVKASTMKYVKYLCLIAQPFNPSGKCWSGGYLTKKIEAKDSVSKK